MENPTTLYIGVMTIVIGVIFFLIYVFKRNYDQKFIDDFLRVLNSKNEKDRSMPIRIAREVAEKKIHSLTIVENESYLIPAQKNSTESSYLKLTVSDNLGQRTYKFFQKKDGWKL